MNRFFLLLCLLGLACQPAEPPVYLFSYFTGNGEDGLHLAASKDGLHWTALRGGASFLTPAVGQDQLMRDPCIIRGGDGRYHMVWTVSWNERGIGYASSPDLVNWSAQRYLPVMEHEPEAQNCWAPELFYDEVKDQYLIYWSTTIPGRYPETDSSGGNGRNHRIYYTTTRDFEALAETQLLYEPGFNVIDAHVQQVDGAYVMFLKNETLLPEEEKNIRIARSDSLYGDYGPASDPITDNWVEGPTAIQIDGQWVEYFDRYRDHHMGAVRSADLQNWIDITDSLAFPEGTRHGTVLAVPRKVLAGLQGMEGDEE